MHVTNSFGRRHYLQYSTAFNEVQMFIAVPTTTRHRYPSLQTLFQLKYVKPVCRKLLFTSPPHLRSVPFNVLSTQLVQISHTRSCTCSTATGHVLRPYKRRKFMFFHILNITTKHHGNICSLYVNKSMLPPVTAGRLCVQATCNSNSSQPTDTQFYRGRIKNYRYLTGQLRNLRSCDRASLQITFQ
jgi:hypothetical protein